MDMGFTRRDWGFTLYSRFEECLRLTISQKLKSSYADYIEGIPTPLKRKIKDRVIEKNWNINWRDVDDFLEATDLPHLKEIVVCNINDGVFFSATESSKDDLIFLLDNINVLRCKIAHIKGYFTTLDLDDLISFTTRIARTIEGFPTEYLQFIDTLHNSPEQILRKAPDDMECYLPSIPNNLPTPDYEFEGGFVGRKDDIRKIRSLVEGDLHRVITISGAGGVGKTALALKVVKDLSLKPDSSFNGIVWLSAKENKLTHLGIEDVEPTVKNYDELIETIFDVLEFEIEKELSLEDKENELNTLVDIYESILIVIDNLETITDDNIYDFILDSNKNLKFLITSRKGLGQVERRYELKELKEKEAVALFRHVAQDKGLQKLATLDDKTITSYVNKVYRYPLAIKWVIGKCALGKDINSIISEINEDSNDISKFCFESIYNDLTEKSKKILFALSLFDESVSAGILKFTCGFSQEEFEDLIQDLILLSLITPEQSKGEDHKIRTSYGLLPLTRGFLRQNLDKEADTKRQLQEKMSSIEIAVQEAEKTKQKYRFSLSNLGAISEEEKVAALLAHTAHQKYEAGLYEEALNLYKEAVKIAPKFSPLYRNWAILESREGHDLDAEKLMQKASELNPKDYMIWLTWGNMRLKKDKLKEALPCFENALEIEPKDPVLLNATGQTYCRLGNYEKANEFFLMACEEGNEKSVRNTIVNFSSLADNHRRWAEDLAKEKNIIDAEIHLKNALSYIDKAINADPTDMKSRMIRQELLKDLGYLLYNINNKKAVRYLKMAYETDVDKYKCYKNRLYCLVKISNILLQESEIDLAIKEVLPKLKKEISKLRHDEQIVVQAKETMTFLESISLSASGKVINISKNKDYVIIESCADSATYFGHIYQYHNEIEMFEDSILGQDVYFVPEERINNGTTQLRAKWFHTKA